MLKTSENWAYKVTHHTLLYRVLDEENNISFLKTVVSKVKYLE